MQDHLYRGITAGQNIRRTGEDIAQHSEVYRQAQTGCRPVAADRCLLGLAELSVVRKLKVAVFSTGDELQAVGQPLGDGQIYDTNPLCGSSDTGKAQTVM